MGFVESSSINSSSCSLLPWFVACLGAWGCNATESGPAEPEPEASLTYFRDVQPVIATHCGSCHAEGGSGHHGLDDYDALVAMAPAVKVAIESGTMPPWPADPECRSFQRERLMSAADQAIVLGWIEEGMAEGDPADAQPIEVPNLDLEEVSVVTRAAEPYTPDASVSDDYHCLVMDVDFSERTFLSATQVVPDASGAVHHIVFFLVPPSGVPALLEADTATDEPGYECFGSSGHGGQPMGVWAPGGVPMRFPAGSAYVIEPGAKIVAQMHYDTSVAPAPDRTELHLAYLSTEPQRRVTMPLLNGFFEIPAGDPAYAVDFEYAVEGEPKQIFSVMPHMHLLGRTIDLRRERAGEEVCIARVDDWDFHWQQFYDLKDSEFVEVRAGDVLRYRCVFDNSAENQPIVDGQRREPGLVSFGESTLDEMCLNVVAMLEPYVEEGPASVCEGVDECYAQSCEPSDGPCFLGCGVQGGDECGGCILQGLAACGMRLCPSEAQAVIACLVSSCDADLSDVEAIQSCLANQCAVEFDAEWACLEPSLSGGECNQDFSPCGLEY